MPPKRTSSKRTLAEVDGEEGTSQATTKKSKQDVTEGSISAQPTNSVLPVDISFAKKTPGALRIAAWNICGLAASMKKVGASVRATCHELTVLGF